MEKISSQFVYFLVFLVLVATTCAVGTSENQTEIDVHLRQVRAASISGCTNVTVRPGACGSSGCNVTFSRSTLGSYSIFLSTSRTTSGFYNIGSLPTYIMFNSICLAANGSGSISCIWGPGHDQDRSIPLATLIGTSSGHFFSTGMNSIPIGIIGTIIARSAVSLGVATINGVASVTVGRVIENAGITVSSYFGGNGVLSFNLCAPK